MSQVMCVQGQTASLDVLMASMRQEIASVNEEAHPKSEDQF